MNYRKNSYSKSIEPFSKKVLWYILHISAHRCPPLGSFFRMLLSGYNAPPLCSRVITKLSLHCSCCFISLLPQKIIKSGLGLMHMDDHNT